MPTKSSPPRRSRNPRPPRRTSAHWSRSSDQRSTRSMRSSLPRSRRTRPGGRSACSNRRPCRRSTPAPPSNLPPGPGNWPAFPRPPRRCQPSYRSARSRRLRYHPSHPRWSHRRSAGLPTRCWCRADKTCTSCCSRLVPLAGLSGRRSSPWSHPDPGRRDRSDCCYRNSRSQWSSGTRRKKLSRGWNCSSSSNSEYRSRRSDTTWSLPRRTCRMRHRLRRLRYHNHSLTVPRRLGWARQ